MKMKIICEECGCEDFRSNTSPLSFKYGSSLMAPCYFCKNCGARYIVVPIGMSVWISRIVCLLVSVGFWFWFFVIKYPMPNDTLLNIAIGVLIFSSLTFGNLLWAWNYLKAFAGVVPLDYWAIHVDENFYLYPHENETADYKIITTSVTKHSVSNWFELAVYRIRTELENGAVKLLKFKLLDDHVELEVKNVNLQKMLIDDSSVILYDLKGKEMCRGKIYKIQQNSMTED